MKLPIPNIRPYQQHSFNRSTTAALYPGLQGSLVPGSTGGAVTNGTTYRECIAIAGASQVTARLKTATAVGTLTITPIRLLAANDPNDQGIYLPDGTIDTTKIQKYGTGATTPVSVAAGTEVTATLTPCGEAYCVVEFAVTTSGTLLYCDVMTLQGTAGSTAGSGSGGGGGTGNVPVQVQDPTQTYVLPTGDADARAIFTKVNGEVASGTTGSALNPVVVGGLDTLTTNVQPLPLQLMSTTPTSTAQEAVSTFSQIAAVGSGNVVRPISNGTGYTDGGSAASSLVVLETRAIGASTHERAFNNIDVSALTSLARTATTTVADQTNHNHRGIIVTLDATVNAGSAGSITLSINGKDVLSGKYYLMLAGVAVTTVGTSQYTIYPGLTTAANVTANGILPRTFQIVVTANNGNPVTYSVGYTLIV